MLNFIGFLVTIFSVIFTMLTFEPISRHCEKHPTGWIASLRELLIFRWIDATPFPEPKSSSDSKIQDVSSKNTIGADDKTTFDTSNNSISYSYIKVVKVHPLKFSITNKWAFYALNSPFLLAAAYAIGIMLISNSKQLLVVGSVSLVVSAYGFLNIFALHASGALGTRSLIVRDGNVYLRRYDWKAGQEEKLCKVEEFALNIWETDDLALFPGGGKTLHIKLTTPENRSIASRRSILWIQSSLIKRLFKCSPEQLVESLETTVRKV